MSDQDLAQKPAFTLDQLSALLSDIRYQPTWRPEADRAGDYYDGLQHTPAEIADLEERGQPVITNNLIQPTINGVLGMEAKTRTDWQVLADDDSGLEVAEALNAELNEAARMSRAYRACADAYGDQIKCGLGWVEVGRNNDPFDYPYRVNFVHRREIFWDWHAQDPNLKDARWLMRRKWLDIDELILAFPDHKDLIEAVATGWSSIDNWDEHEVLSQSSQLMSAYSDHINSPIPEEDWWDSERKRAMTYEIWYRVWERKTVIRSQTGEVAVYDPENRMHNALVASGKVEVIVAPVAKMRLSFFVGPHRLADLDSPHPHNKFPYVPFWGYRENKSRIPYGMIRGMMTPQDEINKRRSRLTWLLNAKLIVADEDAFLNQSNEQVEDIVNSGQGVINMNPGRKNRDHNAFRLITDIGIAQEQFRVMQEAKQTIEDVGGVYSAFLGKESGAKSGVAIDSLVEQGTTTLAEINDNYRFARQQVGELLLAHIVDDIGDNPRDVKINVNQPHKMKVIRLNNRHEDGGQQEITNAVKRTKAQVVVSDTINTPGYRQQMAHNLMQMVSGLPPEFASAFVDMILEMSDIPNREEVLKRIRQITGNVDPEDLSEEEQQQMQRRQEMAQAMEEMGFQEAQLRLEKLAAEAREVTSRAMEREGKAEGFEIENEKTLAEIERIRAEVKDIVTNVAVKRKQFKDTIEGEIALQRRMLPY